MSNRDKLTISGAVLGSLLLSIVLVNAAINWGACAWYGYQTDRDTRFALGVGCMVKTRDHWVPRNELRTEH